jgi:hypothetical protein
MWWSPKRFACSIPCLDLPGQQSGPALSPAPCARRPRAISTRLVQRLRSVRLCTWGVLAQNGAARGSSRSRGPVS